MTEMDTAIAIGTTKKGCRWKSFSFFSLFIYKTYCEDCIISNDKVKIIYNLSLYFRNPLRKSQVRLWLHRLGQAKSLDEKYAIAAQKEFTGPPWEGDSGEKKWAGAMMDVVAKKTAILRAKEFVKYRENILPVYDNLPLPWMNKGVTSMFASC